MIYLRNEIGEPQGKFNLDRAVKIATGKKHNYTRWDNILRTATGNFVLQAISCWQGEPRTYEKITKEEVITLMEQWEYTKEEIQVEFPDYTEEETY